MKKGTRIRFKVVNYHKSSIKWEETGEVAKGKIIGAEWGAYIVHREGFKMPYFVRPDDIISFSRRGGGWRLLEEATGIGEEE